jgi:hypothetical protein
MPLKNEPFTVTRAPRRGSGSAPERLDVEHERSDASHMRDVRCPDGIRPGQLNLLVIRRVVMGDIAVTVVDLALRGLVSVEESADSWRVRPRPVSLSRSRQQSLPGYERKLLEGLDGLAGWEPAPRLPDLALTLEPTLARVRASLVQEAVRQGWIRRLHRHELTANGEHLVASLGRFERQLRQLKAESGQQALTGNLLPYALHYALVSRDQVPLARFAAGWVQAFGDLAGWRAAPRPRPGFSDRGMYDPPVQAG